MKKTLAFLFCLALLLAAAGCGTAPDGAGRAAGGPAGVDEVLQAGIAASDAAASSDTAQSNSAQSSPAPQPAGAEASPASAPDTPVQAADESVDVDLTVLSSTMVYSEVYNMVYTPEDYVGKSVKMNGLYSYYHDEATDAYYFACIIKDATACCSQGIEFVLTEDYQYPDDYPEVGDEITVTGVFDTYLEGEALYCTLRNAHLV